MSPVTFRKVVGGNCWRRTSSIWDDDGRPLLVGQRRSLGHATVADSGSLGLLFGPLARRLGLRFLEVALERPLADTAEVADQLEELIFLGSIHFGGEQNLDVELGCASHLLAPERSDRWPPNAAGGTSGRHGRSC